MKKKIVLKESHFKDCLVKEIRRLESQNSKFREVLELIATPMRRDGTFNRSREVCQKLALDVLKE